MNIPEYVILLHGLARSSQSMVKMEKALSKAGYHVINVNYPSRKFKIEKLAIESILHALSKCPKDATVHFVTHSMGGILIRYYLSQKSIDNLGHVVMLGPPNKGSEVVDTLGKLALFRIINGPAGLQLGTDQNSMPNQIGPANFSLGIIAGNQTINFILSAIISGRNDGKVSVQNTKLEGMKDHLVLAVTHPFMMKNNHVIKQVRHFLKNGQFEH